MSHGSDQLRDVNAVMEKPCLICGRRNIEHMVFYNPYMKWHQRHTVREGVTDDCVPGWDHYSCIDNLEYLEHVSKTRET